VFLDLHDGMVAACLSLPGSSNYIIGGRLPRRL